MHAELSSVSVGKIVSVGIVLMLSVLNLAKGLTQIALRKKKRQFIETYEFSNALKAKFANSNKFSEPSQQELVFTALRDYFYICHRADKLMVSMPSQIVDDAWHQFILFTKDYNDFCLKAFGRFLHHTPAEAMETETQAQAGIKRAWHFRCERENLNQNHPDRLPLIFAIDSTLNIENGFLYSLNCLPTSNHDDRAINMGYCATHIGCGGSSGCSASGGGDSAGAVGMDVEVGVVAGAAVGVAGDKAN